MRLHVWSTPSGAQIIYINNALLNLHWLQIQKRIRFKMAVLVYRALRGLSPSYLHNFTPLSVSSSVQIYIRRYLIDCLFLVRVSLLSLIAHFSIVGASVWCDLPMDIASSRASVWYELPMDIASSRPSTFSAPVWKHTYLHFHFQARFNCWLLFSWLLFYYWCHANLGTLNTSE